MLTVCLFPQNGGCYVKSDSWRKSHYFNLYPLFDAETFHIIVTSSTVPVLQLKYTTLSNTVWQQNIFELSQTYRNISGESKMPWVQ